MQFLRDLGMEWPFALNCYVQKFSYDSRAKLLFNFFQLDCNVRERARKHLDSLDELEREKKFKTMVSALVAASTCLINDLPIVNQIVSGARVLHPTLQMKKMHHQLFGDC